jgi:lipopolysaccharide transport system permease protein
MPLSTTISSLLKFGIQFLFFIAVLVYFICQEQAPIPNWTIVFTPFLLLIMALLSLGLGMIISSLTTKYKDLTFLFSFGIQLFMYVTPVVYPTSLVLSKLNPKWHWLIHLNPLSSVFEFFRYAFLGNGIFTFAGLMISFVTAVFLFLLGLLIFNRTERNFIDTV